MNKSISILFIIMIFFIILQNYQINGKSPFKVHNQQIKSACITDVLNVLSHTDGPPGRRNRWQGTIFLDQWPNENSILLELHLSNTARLTLVNPSGTTTQTKSGHQIIINEPTSRIKQIDFNIDGKPNQPFPEPIGLYLNGFDICNCGNNCNNLSSVETENSTKNPLKKHERPTKFSENSENIESQVVVEDDHISMIDVKNPEILKCGERKVFHKTLIKNGYDTQPGEYPWHAAIFLRTTIDSPSTDYICGGSLISKSIIITAAHCTHQNDQIVIPQRLLVKLGLYNRLISSTNTKEFQVYEIFVPRTFDLTSNKNDFAILKLSNYVQFSNFIQPICLWPNNDIELNSIIGKPGIVIGWGLNENAQLSNALKTAKMPVISQINCLEANPSLFGSLLSETNYCAGYRNGTSVCNGDSGGGMVFQINEIFYLRGIVSVAESLRDSDECNPREYVLFTDVAKFLDFIQNKIK